MIAVAGYFSYMNNNIEEELVTVSTDAELLESAYDISEEDLYLSDEIFTDEGVIGEVAAADTEAAETMGDDAIENPGETILTSTTITNLDYAAEIKLNREQIRSKNKASLLEIVNNEAIEDALKQEAVNKMIALTDIAEREAAAEMLLEAKGFTDVVVSITDDQCDVVLNMGDVTDAKRAQVEDIVKRKTNISADQIVITPINIGESD
jgi:stage III sporulation protein AH